MTRVLVFDSGVGGLTVVTELQRQDPDLVVHYAADTGFFPYGTKSDRALKDRLPRVANALYEQLEPDAFVIACNTASTLALEDVRAALPIPVIGTVPAIKPAASLTKTGVFGLLATPGTIGRTYTSDLIAQFASACTVICHGSSELVTLSERVAAGEAVHDREIAACQAPLFEAQHGDKIDTIVLACTHFPLVRDILVRTAPQEIDYIDTGAAIARQTLRVAPTQITGRTEAPPTVFLTGPAANNRSHQVFERFGFHREVQIEVEPVT